MRSRTICAALLTTTAQLAGAESKAVAWRIATRDFPSIFQAWNPARPPPGHSADATLALHDLVFLSPSQLGLKSDGTHEGMAVTFAPASVSAAKARRAALLAKNVHLILLGEIRYRDAPSGFLPDDSPWWKRNHKGEYVFGWAEGGYRLLDFPQPEWQSMVAKRAQAVMATGVFDGVMPDW